MKPSLTHYRCSVEELWPTKEIWEYYQCQQVQLCLVKIIFVLLRILSAQEIALHLKASAISYFSKHASKASETNMWILFIIFIWRQLPNDLYERLYPVELDNYSWMTDHACSCVIRGSIYSRFCWFDFSIKPGFIENYIKEA